MNLRGWGRDLALGVRFAFSGGREGWVRLTLTALGVGLGVAMLLLSTALPNVLATREAREQARMDFGSSEIDSRADNTLLLAHVDTAYRGKSIRGRLLEPEGPRAPLPPGVAEFPAKGEMVVSPALKKLLASDGGGLLRERLPYRITGTVGEPGLVGSQELVYYAGAEGMEEDTDGAWVVRLERFGEARPAEEPMDPVLMMLNLVAIVVLLMPVAVFVAAAVRIGGERRDRRLAALRLVGSDTLMTRRIAAGEALSGALLGLVVGFGLFLVGRQVAGSIELFGVSVFPSYLDPSPVLAALVAVAVPVAAVGVTLLTLRGVVIEPLGVVRTAKPARRRLWWRLLLPLAGLGLLAPMLGQGRDSGYFNEYQVASGVLLLLVGVTALLPWLVETVVARLGAGGLSWQLAVRRLQLSSGTAARMVNGIAVAVAGSIAMQMLFVGVEGDYTSSTGRDLRRAQMEAAVPQGASIDETATKYAGTKGVQHVIALSETSVGDAAWLGEGPNATTGVSVGSCPNLRELATLPSCRDGDVFFLTNSADPGEDSSELATPGRTVYFAPDGDEEDPGVTWTVPAGVRQVPALAHPTGIQRGGFLITPSALTPEAAGTLNGRLYLSVDESVPDAFEYVRNTAATISPLAQPFVWSQLKVASRYASLRTGLLVGAAAILALIGASLLVSQLEQLRERRKLLSSLVAFGTRRRTLGLSVLWQTAIPIALGLLLAAAVGITLGALLLRMADQRVVVDWWTVLSMSGIGAAVVLAVTLLSLPPLLRLLRPDGLRTE
ncbi:FtsX-like permease family protein [Streptomyces sp. NPDC018693]|uniref:FtsX-like permease family protein n=1 Tax=unclassified Streptomyces TaxID=2593676 RepID=UPI0037B55FF6